MKMRVVASMSMMVMAGGLWLGAQVKDFRPVTEAMLRNPAAGDWLNWRRTDNAWGYSPLDQINAAERPATSTRVVVGDGRHGLAAGDTARVRRHHVPAESAWGHPGAGRRNRRPDREYGPR